MARTPSLHDQNLATDNKSASVGRQSQQTVQGQLREIFLDSWLNIALLAVPVGLILGALKQNAISVFVINFIAIIPLASLLSKATDGLSSLVGSGTAALLNASFGSWPPDYSFSGRNFANLGDRNAVELIVSIIALKHREVLIVQTSLIGSIISNLLLVTGTSFLLGGLHPLRINSQQVFDQMVAQTYSGLLILAVGSLIVPTAYRAWAPSAVLISFKSETLLTVPRQYCWASWIITRDIDHITSPLHLRSSFSVQNSYYIL